MSNDPKLRQEVYGDGDNVTGNAMDGTWGVVSLRRRSQAWKTVDG